MTNEELIAVIYEARLALADLWPWQRQRKKVWTHQLEFFLNLQRQRAAAAAAPAAYMGAPTVDDQVREAQKPHCVHGRRMPVAHLNDPGEPCDLCEEGGNGVPLPEGEPSAFVGNEAQASFRVEHSPECNTNKPDFVPSVTGPQQCNCDFGRRLAAALGLPYEPSGKLGSVSVAPWQDWPD